MIIADKLLYLRKKLGYTQEELAEQLNVSRQSISKWESAQSIPDITKIMAMAQLFSVSTDYLLRDDIETLDGEAHPPALTEQDARVTIEVANDFISAYAKHTKQVALGVFLCIFAVVPLISMAAFIENSPYENAGCAFGLCFIFLSVVTAVCLFIYSDHVMEEYQYILHGEFELSFHVSGILKEQQKLYMPLRTKKMMLHIALLILSPIPLIISGLLSDAEVIHISMTVLLLTIIAVVVSRMIRSEGAKECYDILLSEGDFRKSTLKCNKKKEMIQDIYWSLAVAIYLIWSFLTKDWQITWLVWPVAGLLSTGLSLFWLDDDK